MGDEARAPAEGVVYRSAEFGLFLFCGVQCICFKRAPSALLMLAYLNV